jgi:hypothetical protein
MTGCHLAVQNQRGGPKAASHGLESGSSRYFAPSHTANSAPDLNAPT